MSRDQRLIRSLRQGSLPGWAEALERGSVALEAIEPGRRAKLRRRPISFDLLPNPDIEDRHIQTRKT